MALTYEPIASTTLSVNTANVTFSSIPSTYTDLVFVVNGGMATLGAMTVQFNSDTAANYSYTRLFGDGTSASSDRVSNANYLDLGYFPVNLNNNSIFSIMNYSNTTTHKTVVGRWNTPSYAMAEVGLWRSTAAINSIKFYNSSGYGLLSGSTFTLYGIKAA